MKFKSTLFILLFLFVIEFCFAVDNYDYITDIEVQGNVNVSSSLIISIAGLSQGNIYDKEDIKSAIKNLFKLHLFKDIKINQTVSDSGVKLVIAVVEFPILNKISISGNKKIKKTKILEVVDVSSGEYWSPKEEFTISNKILDLYREKGYRLASLDFKKNPLSNNRLNLNIIIDEGKKVKIDKIIFSGNEKISSKKLRKIMKTHEKGFLRSGEFKLEKFDEDLVRITDYFKSKGFINAEVLDWTKQYDDDGYLIITIELYEGRQYRISSVDISGNSRFSDNVLKNELKIKSGEIFNQEEFDKKLNSIRMMYYEDGYIYSIINQETKTEADSLFLTLHINENTRAKVRKIKITGNQKTRESVIRRKLAITPGDYFRQSLIQRSQRNIYNLGFFTPNMGLDYQPINDVGDIDLIFTLEDKISGNANFGVNYDQTNNFTGFVSVEHNNILGKALQLKLKWEFSGSKQNYSISFTNPYFFNRNMLVGCDVFHTKNDWSDYNYTVTKTGGGLRFGTSIPFINYARFTTGYSITQKEYSILDDGYDVIDVVQNLVDEGKKITSNGYISLERDSRNNIYRPSQGSLLQSYSELAGGFIGGNVNYFKEIVQSNWYIPLFWKFALGTKWRMGYISAFGSTDDVPLDEKFYPGGIGPDGIRGYDDRSIIPENSDGANAELIISSDITFPISGDQVVGVAFFDAGNSYIHFSKINVQELKKGAGLGVRIMTPMGLMGFDYAYGFDRTTNNKWKFHFQFGTTF
ncbi:MAG: outer membrane protein assembly factor BamA [Candidatus Cloacimonadota bacterium]|nr:outer membrane protein assembly factor BamA [Candidatus Cloacimonadota bacterium]